jgi:lipopolysaccharide export system permease protein
MKISIIYKYIFKELVLTFLLGLAFLNSILMMNNLFSLSKKFLGVGIPFIDFFTLTILLQPQLMLLTIPIALLLSILIAYGRLSIDSELIILRASGMSLVRIGKPVFTAGALCFILSLFISFYLGPLSVSKLREKINEIMSNRLSLSIKEGIFNTAFEDIVIMPRGKTSEDTFAGMFIYDGRKKDPAVVWAREGTVSLQKDLGSINIELKNGTLHFMHSVKGNTVTEIACDKYTLRLKLDLPSTTKDIHELSLRGLLHRTRESKDVSAALEFHRRLSLPIVSLLLMFVGLPLLPMTGKTGRLWGLNIGLSVCVMYYMASIYLDNMVRAGKLHHIIGGWAPTVLLGIGAVAVFYRTAKRL